MTTKSNAHSFLALSKITDFVGNDTNSSQGQSHEQQNEMAIGDCVLAKISKNDDQPVDDNDINVNN